MKASRRGRKPASPSRNERVAPPLPQGLVSLGAFRFEPGKPAAVTIPTTGADGTVQADAVQLLPVP